MHPCFKANYVNEWMILKLSFLDSYSMIFYDLLRKTFLVSHGLRLPLFARVDVIEGALPDVLLSQM